MIDIKFLREKPELVKENMKKKFQDHKLVLVDEVLDLDSKNREIKLKGDDLRSKRNSLSQEIGNLMKQGKKEEAEDIKKQVQAINQELLENEKLEEEYSTQITQRMMKIPNIIHDSVPIR
jgi:seryl-tRNA synthetase